MYVSKEILNLEYPYNILYVIGIKNPIQDQLKGLNYVINTLDEKSKNLLFLRFEKRLSLEEIANFYGVTKQAVSDRVNRKLKKLCDSDYIKLGYESVLSKEKEYNSFENVYKRVMSKQEKDKENIKKVKEYLFDKTKIPIELKEIGIDYYRSGKLVLPFLVRTFNALMKSKICRLNEYSWNNSYNGEKPNVYALLYHIYENPFNLIKIRTLGEVGVIDVYSTLYNMKYITEEQLLFVYLYGQLYKIKSFDNFKNFYFTYKEQIRIGG